MFMGKDSKGRKKFITCSRDQEGKGKEDETTGGRVFQKEDGKKVMGRAGEIVHG